MAKQKNLLLTNRSLKRGKTHRQTESISKSPFIVGGIIPFLESNERCYKLSVYSAVDKLVRAKKLFSKWQSDWLLSKSSDVIDPKKITTNEKERFTDLLYLLHSNIFTGVQRHEFAAYVVDSQADWTRIRIYKNRAGEWIGYCAVHRFKNYIFDRPCVVIRAEAGILREYRGRSITLWFGFKEALKYRIKHPFCDLYYLGSFVHPSVLYMFSRYFSEYYPRADAPIPDNIKFLMLELAKVFHLKPVEGQDVLVRQVGWRTKESMEDQSFWQKHPNPVVKFYIKTNPGYASGNGMLTLVPLTFRNIIMSLIRFIKNKIVRRIT